MSTEAAVLSTASPREEIAAVCGTFGAAGPLSESGELGLEPFAPLLEPGGEHGERANRAPFAQRGHLASGDPGDQIAEVARPGCRVPKAQPCAAAAWTAFDRRSALVPVRARASAFIADNDASH